MQSYLQSKKGFAINHELADNFNILDEFLVWEEEFNDLPFLESFEEKFSLVPDEIKHFEYEMEYDEYSKGVQGFEFGLTYVLFDKSIEKIYTEEWDNFINFLEENDVDLSEGSWLELV